MIYYITILARYFGWSETYILDLPYYKVLLYVHAILCSEGHNLRWVNSGTDAKIDSQTLTDMLADI